MYSGVRSPSHTRTIPTSSSRQCAAVRTARGPMIVPEQEPSVWFPEVRMFSFTTGDVVTLHSAPLRIAVLPDMEPRRPRAPHASAAGIGAGEVGGVGAEPPPQPASNRTDARTAAHIGRFIRLPILTWGPVRPVPWLNSCFW